MDNKENINPACEGIRQILDENRIHSHWKRVFNDELSIALKCSFDEFTQHITENNIESIPERSNILRFLSGCGPREIKVVIVGHDPIGDKELATGVAFSFPRKLNKVDKNVGFQRNMLLLSGRSIAILHEVLVDAG